MISKKVNVILLLVLFAITILLWTKLIYDFANYKNRINFLLIAIVSLGFLIYIFVGTKLCIAILTSQNKNIAMVQDKWMWLFIPLSVLCTSPVCYKGTIFIAPYLISTIIRLSLLLMPAILFFTKKLHSEKGVFVLLFLGLLSFIPNDKCNNMFNYSWIKWIGASPLTYFPSIIPIIIYSFYIYGSLTKVQAFFSFSLVCLGALVLALGHRIELLW